MPSTDLTGTIKDQSENRLGVLYLHALPLDETMWVEQMDLHPNTYAPNLYALGSGIEEWAKAAMETVQEDKVIVVGCSVGGSCAIEVALAYPDRVAALVLIGTKAGHKPNPEFHASAIQLLEQQGMEDAWQTYWEPFFSASTDRHVVEKAKAIAMQQGVGPVSLGTSVFHTRPCRDGALSSITCPVSVVSGAEDIAPGIQKSREQADAMPNASLHVIPNCGHYVSMEQPQALNALLTQVIDTEMAGLHHA
ncbi:MAG: alpha/beta hydrolase [Alphaproteobacteria bacterium]